MCRRFLFCIYGMQIKLLGDIHEQLAFRGSTGVNHVEAQSLLGAGGVAGPIGGNSMRPFRDA
jgi:hypothetical protein